MHRFDGSHTRRSLSLLLVVMLAFALLPGTASAVAQDIYVDEQTGSDTTGDGSPGNPYKSISWGMRAASSGDTVWVEAGTYDTSVEPMFPVVLKPGVALRAVDGYGYVTVNAEGAGRVFQLTDPTSGTLIEGLTITGGQTAVNGGGLLIDYSIASDLIGWPKIVHCTFDSNVSGVAQRGGGVHVTSGPNILGPEFTLCYFSENVGGVGGGLSLAGKTSPTLEDCTFDENTAQTQGGGIFALDQFNITLDNCDFRSNSATNDQGGAVFLGGGSVLGTSLSATDGFFFDNSTNAPSDDGGAIYAHLTTVDIEKTKFSSNTATGDGGALSLRDARGYLTDCFMHDNTGDDGSVLYTSGSTVATMTHCTVMRNTATDNYAVIGGGSQLAIFNSIFWQNSGTEDLSGAFSIFESCTEQVAGVTGPGVIHTDPEFKDPSERDYRLENDSPCIDTAGTIESDGDDFDGQDRPTDGDGDGNAASDMGCWERPALAVDRYAGTNRYDTACQMAEAAFDEADTAIMASGGDFPDALSAAGLAGAYNAPLLLTGKDSVPSEVRGTLAVLGVDEVILVGGEAVISPAVKTWLENQGTAVSRIAGVNRYATSAAVAQEVASKMSGGPGSFGDYPAAFFARGDDFPDALAVAPLAYAERRPILLVETDSLPREISDVMSAIDVEIGFVCGGTGAVSGPTKTAIDDVLVSNGGWASTRWWGSDRYATAVAIAAGGVVERFVDFEYVGIATGGNFPDALAGGMLAGGNDGVVLLTPTDSLAAATSAALQANRDTVVWAEVYGGTSAVNSSVQSAVDSALGW